MAVAIKGQVALVTGASRGIGRACALSLAREGCRLALLARDEAALNDTVAQCAALGVETLPLLCDLRDRQALAAAVERCAAELGGLNILVNNAGVWHGGTAAEAEADGIDEMIDVNLRAVVQLTRLALPHIIAGAEGSTGRGAIVFISSMSGVRSYAGGSGYCATKFGVNGFASAVFDDVGKLGIKVSTLCPGWVNTAMGADSEVPPDEMVQPEDVAELARLVATWPNSSCPMLITIYPQTVPVHF
jgi:NAD(P)-dependent dehydrogenase (short-subunit alcohol dehydrogenase family)